eukprot:TRINITY_DN66286_c7_g1_i1.p1 TRINITY_DN66286_c7_g1~~TRINITY_DN66286_c7_g1_i1.p1  ORF type:complete len:205 (+),score=109.22 TRINITY_DN66286_c7_g1_i1:59-673(+)
MSSQICFQFRDEGSCKFGSQCRFLHDGEETRGSRTKSTQVCYDLRDKGECAYGDSCRFSHDLSLASEQKNDSGMSSQSAAAPAPKVSVPNGVTFGDEAMKRLSCRQYQENGECEFGLTCRFLHGTEHTRGYITKTTELCFAHKEGECEHGDGCKFSHDLSLPVVKKVRTRRNRNRNRKKDNICNVWRQSGTCDYGDDCRFEHPQ